MKRGTLFIRADASSEIGTGHVMRMLALAHAWRNSHGESPVFLCAGIPDALASRVRAEGFGLSILECGTGPESDAYATLREVEKCRGEGVAEACWVAADGYGFPEVFQTRVRTGGCRLLVVDDNAENRKYAADLVLNQNIQAREADYAHRAARTRLLLGPRYALLRPEFALLRSTFTGNRAHGLRVIVTLGGSDPACATELVLKAMGLIHRPDDDLTVVVGPGNPRRAELKSLLSRLRWRSAEARWDVADMATLMHSADVAITAGGSTCWELCMLGVPMLALVVADNQHGIVRGLAEEGAALDGGDARLVNPVSLAAEIDRLLGDGEKRAALSARARTLVDGQGAARVRDVMGELGDRP